MTPSGTISGVVGPMFAGKTTAMIRDVEAARLMGGAVQIFRHTIDDRFSEDCIVSHDGHRLGGVELVSCAKDCIVDGKTEWVFIDEAQFFDIDIAVAIERWALDGKNVRFYGLDLDSAGRTFETSAQLVAVADVVTKLRGQCAHCGADSMYSQRAADVDQGVRVLVGAAECYTPVCRSCFQRPT